MTNTQNPHPEAIVRATDDAFVAEFRIREDGVTVARYAMIGEEFDTEWVSPPEFHNRITLGGRFTAPTSIEDIAHRLRRNIGKPGNWATVEVVR